VLTNKYVYIRNTNIYLKVNDAQMNLLINMEQTTQEATHISN